MSLIVALSAGSNCAHAANITTLSPASAQQGQTLNVAITGQGTNFSQLTSTANFGTGITVNSLTVNTPTAAVANITISPTAALGTRTVSVTTGSEIDSIVNGFTVTPGTPVIQSLSPSNAPQGQNLTVAITALYTHFVQGTSTANFGTGITVNSLTVSTPTTATASISIGAAAPPGASTVSITTGTEIASITNGFTVTPVIESVSPGSGQQGQAVKVAITGLGTHFVQATSTANFGTGITVNSLTVSTSTTATASITISASESLGPRTISVTTGTETVSFVNGFAVTPGTPVIKSLSPNNAPPGQNLTVAITALYTHFVQGTSTANFGTGITVNSLTVSTPTTATANISISPTATLGTRTVSVTTGTEAASITNGFTVTPVIQSLSPNYGPQGQTVAVAIKGLGTHFVQGTSTANFGTGITVNSLTVSTPTTATASITISTTAATGARTISVTTGTETASIINGFTVTPVLERLSPNTSQQGQTLTVAITGLGTHYAQGTSTASFGAGVTVNSLTVSTPTAATASITISPTAVPGKRTVSITTGSETDILVNSFTVAPGTPVIQSLSVNSGSPRQTLTVAITGVYTHFVQGSSRASFGIDVTVNSLTVSSPTTATANITVDASAAPGSRTVSINTGSETASIASGFTVVTSTSPPVITTFSPTSASIGTLINLSGNNLVGANGVTPQVTLNHQGGGTIAAPLSTYTNTTLSFVVPTGAATGPITVTVAGQSVTSSGALTVTPPSSYTVGVAPASGTLIQGQSTTFSVTLNSSNGFTGLSALSVTGLPSGVTASFNPPSIAVSQTSILTLSAPANQTKGMSALTVTASATIAGQQVSQSASISLQVTGVTTSFVGRTVVDDATQTPIVGVLVMFTGLDDKGNHTGCTGETVSDASGNFALTNLPGNCVGPQLIFYNGLTATAPTGKFAGVNLSYTLTANQVTTSPVLIHLPRIDNAESVQVTQNAAVDQSFTFHTIPGLRVTVYAGTTLTLDDGTHPNPFPLIAIGIPIDRLPDKIATSGMLTTFIVAFQPANAVASQPVAVHFPNPLPMDPGTSATLMTLDPTHGYMVPYGTGTVSKDGAVFDPDPDPAHPGHLYGLIHFDWHGPAAPPPPGVNPSPSGCGGSGGGPNPPACAVGGPVDVSSGIVSYNSTDIRINGGRSPIAINRIYRTLSNNPGPFGLGTSHNYGYVLNTFAFIQGQSVITLVMPDGNQFPLSLVSGNTFANTTVPALRGATLTTNGRSGPYVLRWGNGVQYVFGTTSAGIREAFLTSITDLNGNTTTLTLNPSQPLQIQTITDAVGRSLTLSYDNSNRITQITDPIGRRVSYTYNSQGMLASFTDANGGVTTYTYDSANNLASITDPRNVVTEQNTYNESFDGRITQQITADGGVYSFAYTLLNAGVSTSPVQQTVVTDPQGNQTTYRFNPQGFLVSATDPAGQTRTMARDSGHNNLVTSYQGPGVCPVCGNPASGDVSYTFDQFGNTLTQTDALGNTTTFSYDLRFNKVATITDPLNHATKFTYDTNGNLLTVADANGNTTQFAYDTFGDMVQITDPIGSKMSLAYDSFGNVSQITDALGNVTSLSYDAVGRLAQTIDALGRTSTLVYDKLDRVTNQSDPKGNTTSFTYDAIGNVLSAKDARGNAVTFTYDQLSRLESRTSPLGKSETYSYDHDSNVIQYVDRRSQTSAFQYDVLNRLTKEIYADAAVTRSYDANSRLVSVADSAGGSFGFNYDAGGRLLTQYEPTGTVQYTRDVLGRVVTRQVAGQSAIQYSYDPVGNLLGASTTSAGITFTYDARNLPQSLTRTNGVVTKYSFDQVDRISSLVHTMGSTALNTQSYTYDSVGTRLAVNNDISQPLITQSALATVDNANELLTNGQATYTYDANGNRLTETNSSGTTTYTWDGRNRLSAIKDNSGNTTTFQYDFNRNLLTIDRTISGSTTQQAFVIDSVANVASLTDVSGSPVSVLTGRSTDSHFASVDAAGNVLFGIGDALSSNTAVTDVSGVSTHKLFYEPYGQTSGTVAANFPFAFAGRVPVLGNIYYNRHRFYDSGTGRFLSEDPLRFKGGDINLYRYVWDNPTNYIDPTGDWGFGVSGGGSVEGGVVVAGAGATGSIGGGLFFDGWSPSLGGFASFGAFAGGPGWGASYPSCPSNSNWALGAFAGGGLNLFATNASNVSDLSGPFTTYSFNAGWGVRVLTVQFSIGTNAAGQTIGILSYGGPLPGVGVPTGGGYGVSLSKYNTNTWTTGGGPGGGAGQCGCP